MESLHIADEISAAMLALEVLGHDILMICQMCGTRMTGPHFVSTEICFEQFTHRYGIRRGCSRKEIMVQMF